MPHAAAFKTPRGVAEYLAAYDAALARWPAPYDEVDVPTRFGSTHVVVSGPPDAPPLVLLHGYMATLLMWIPNVGDLCQHYRVYAIDVMGQPGKTIPSEPIRDAAGFVTWLTATLNGLHLDRVALMGMSFGGWVALTYAVAEPDRVAQLLLLSPGGLLPIRRQFALRGMVMTLLPTPFTVSWFMRWAGFRDSPGRTEIRQLCHLMYLGMKHFRMPRETLRVAALPLPDDQLRNLRMPVLLLLGDREVLCDPGSALARARRFIPDVAGELVPGCSHDMCFSQARLLDARVLQFLRDHPPQHAERLATPLSA
jgi:pimeloyl-ACP methyl ester carboxylesterase